MSLVPDWREALRWHSTQVFVALAAIPPVWAELPEDLKGFVPAGWRPWIVAGIALIGLLGRLRAQDGRRGR